MPRSWFTGVFVSLLVAGASFAQDGGQIHVLIVSDTCDPAIGKAVGLDAQNMKQVLEEGLKKQDLDGKLSLKVIKGLDLTRDALLKALRDLEVKPDDTILFYYTGHGGYNLQKGQYFPFNSDTERVYRSEVKEILLRHKARLAINYTDCCNNLNYNDGAWREEPPVHKQYRAPLMRQSDAYPRTPQKNEEPKVLQTLKTKEFKLKPPARKDMDQPIEKRKIFDGNQIVELSQIIEKMDGVLLKQLLVDNKGYVDFNACKKGKLSGTNMAFGGSYGTIAFFALLNQPIREFDANKDSKVSWREFFGVYASTTLSFSGVTTPHEPEIVELKD